MQVVDSATAAGESLEDPFSPFAGLTAYIAGPMTGIPDFNYPAFHAAAERLREYGLVVHNPAEHFNGDNSLPYATYIRAALQSIMDSDIVVVLPGWMHSRGALLELHTATVLGKEVFDLETLRMLPHQSVEDICYVAWKREYFNRVEGPSDRND